MVNENGAPEPPTLRCEVCGRPYKTERGRTAHMAKVHPVSDDTRTPWMATWDEPPPRPVPGASSADYDTIATRPSLPPPGAPPPPSPAAPPPTEAFRWSRPSADATQAMAPPPMPPPPTSPGLPAPPPEYAPARVPPFRSLRDLAGLTSLLFLLAILFLIIAFAANAYLAGTVPPKASADLFRKVDDNQWIAWAAAAGFVVLAYLTAILWLHRAYRNQLPLGAPATGMPASLVVVLCFVPIVNLVIFTLAVREIWRNADLQRHEWVGRARRSKVPGGLSMVWLGPVLAALACIGFGLIVSDRIGPDGVTSVKDARILYVSRCVLLLELFLVTLGIRRVFGLVTDQQERAQWHYQMGRGAAPAPQTSAPGSAYPTVPS